MDNQEAKFILSACRPGGQDAKDPRFSDALDQAKRDPILKRWFEESVIFDAAVTEKLCAIAVPSDLRENILAGAKITRPPRWSKPLRLALAAAVVAMGAGASLLWQTARPVHLSGWQTQSLAVISSLVRMKSAFDAQSHAPAQLLAWLRENHAPAAETLPSHLENLKSLGCKTFSWNGTPVSVICFMRPEGGHVHLVTTDATSAITGHWKTTPTLLRQGDWTTATWREGNKIYMVAIEGSPEQLQPYVS